jgi:hypothetical protein
VPQGLPPAPKWRQFEKDWQRLDWKELKAGNYVNLLAVALRYCPCLEFVEDGEPYVPGEESNDKLG